MLCSHLTSSFVSISMVLSQFNIECLTYGDANAGRRAEPILYINIYVAIDTMSNFDFDTNTDARV